MQPPTAEEARKRSRPKPIKLNTEEDLNTYSGLKLGDALEDDLALAAASAKPGIDISAVGKVRPEVSSLRVGKQ